jgi:carbonic anhydrase
VRQTISDILEQSEIISEMVSTGDLLIVGGVYDLATGRVAWLDE